MLGARTRFRPDGRARPDTVADSAYESLRFAELMACLAAACELAMGQNADHALHTCAVAMRLAEAWGLRASELRIRLSTPTQI